MIEHCGLVYVQPAPGGHAAKVARLVYLGDDHTGQPLEVMAVELGGGELLVIHAMPLRERYMRQYLEGIKWRR